MPTPALLTKEDLPLRKDALFQADASVKDFAPLTWGAKTDFQEGSYGE